MTRRAFTLIELLVVIAIIALLLGILLPSLASARESAKTLVCKQRNRELALVTGFYANDHQDRIWPIVTANGAQRYTWARVWNPQRARFEPGPVFSYLDNVTEVLACPTNARRSVTGTSSSDLFAFQFNELDFDFTMITGTQGARISRDIGLYYLDRTVESAPAGVGRTWYPRQQNHDFLTRFRAMPVFVEESVYWYNGTYTDGLWGNQDQFSSRHRGTAHYAMVDGTVGSIGGVSGAAENLMEPGQDLLAKEIYALLPMSSSGAIQFRSLYGYNEEYRTPNALLDASRW